MRYTVFIDTLEVVSQTHSLGHEKEGSRMRGCSAGGIAWMARAKAPGQKARSPGGIATGEAEVGLPVVLSTRSPV